MVTTNGSAHPIGEVARIPGARPKDLAVSPNGSLVAVLTTSGVVPRPQGRAGLVTVTLEPRPGPAGAVLLTAGAGRAAAQQPGGMGVFQLRPRPGNAWKAVSFRAVNPAKSTTSFTASRCFAESSAKASGPRAKGDAEVAGLALPHDGRRLYVALEHHLADRVFVWIFQTKEFWP